MRLDKYGLPVQADGDRGDQLNRVGILALSDEAWYKKLTYLYCYPGKYVRHINGNPNNVSGDQLVPVFAAQMLTTHPQRDARFGDITLAMFKRLGFAQNTHDTTPGKRKLLPDFLLHRVLPFIARVYVPVYSGGPFSQLKVYIGHAIVCLADTALFLNTLVTVIDLRSRNNPDHVDPFVNACATLYSCNVYRPTYLSKLSARMLEAGAINTTGFADAKRTGLSPVMSGLVWYHRADSGGNPEVGTVQVRQWSETLKIARR